MIAFLLAAAAPILLALGIAIGLWWADRRWISRTRREQLRAVVNDLRPAWAEGRGKPPQGTEALRPARCVPHAERRVVSIDEARNRRLN